MAVVSFRMEPAAPEKLLEAFKLFDAEGKGTISKEQMTKLMMEEGEPFSQVNLLLFFVFFLFFHFENYFKSVFSMRR